MNNVVLPQTIEEESTKARSNAYGMRDHSLTGESATTDDVNKVDKVKTYCYLFCHGTSAKQASL